MRLSNSKHQLARLLIEAGVKEFPNGADWVAQGSNDLKASFYSGYKPKREFGEDTFFGEHCGRCHDVQLPVLINNWHQTALSRDEFDLIVAKTIAQREPDADGWIKWGGAPRSPVSKGTPVDVKKQNGTQHFGRLIDDEYWSDCWGGASIIAYRLHKPEQANSESVAEAKPTIEQLAADYHNAKDYADRKQQEADAAKADAKAKLAELVAAGEALGLTLSVTGAESEPELSITNWRDLQVDDLIWYGGDNELSSGEYHVMGIEAPDYEGYRPVLVNGNNGDHWIDIRAGWGFIRRP